MKKIITLVAAFCFVSSLAFAGAIAGLNLDNTAGPILDASGAAKFNLFPLYGGVTGGVAAGGSVNSLDAGGLVILGTAKVTGNEIAAAGASSSSYGGGLTVFQPNAAIGTNASAFGSSVSYLKTERTGLALADGTFSGQVGEGSGAAAGIINAPILNATNGHTDVQGAQGGIGGYTGFATTGIVTKTSEIDVNMAISGQSNVASGREGAIVSTPGLGVGIQEGLGSVANVGTIVTSDVNKTGLSGAIGGYAVAGGAGMDASQVGKFQPATASANAVGAYVGAGPLGTNYQGSAIGNVSTQITQYPHAVVSQSSGSMGVTSIITP